jgi:hypothetical protein
MMNKTIPVLTGMIFPGSCSAVLWAVCPFDTRGQGGSGLPAYHSIYMEVLVVKIGHGIWPTLAVRVAQDFLLTTASTQ